ncbi:DUF6515 family protein [Chitinophaga japonensis]|uniref:WG repeat protein n=1 Tax=Chitinophaga japonensis TaxID=104662 RepID=A0A562SSJ3_CHIJA|nr:DUF6515 family protein [Chitinophaga japonensis]TWI83994.1 hypothetical protein LX66_4355 [Chitinophaga japonensis]
MKASIFLAAALAGGLITGLAGEARAQRARVHVGVGAHFGGPRYYYHPPVRYYRAYPRPFYPYYYPFGMRVSVLPYGFVTLGTAWGPYFYYDGVFYRSRGDSERKQEYEVAEPPIGADVPSLPSGAREVVIDGNTYYEYKGTYYQEVIRQNERRYAIVGKNGQLAIGGEDNNPVPGSEPAVPGEIITDLPQDCHEVEINGQVLYVSPDGMYYEEVRQGDTITGYRVVGKQRAD